MQKARRITGVTAVAALGAAVLATAVCAAAVAARGPVALAELTIPQIHLETPVYQQVTGATLGLGAGHYADTNMPGAGHGIVAVAAHRVTPVGGRPYGPFRFIDRLRRGDPISVERQIAGRTMTFRYVVFKTLVVRPTFVSWLYTDPTVETLVLTSCTPPGSATYRILVFAHRVR